jgi:IS1 family transposase
MASNATTVSCNGPNKKTKMVDPNLFYGQSSSNNISVPLEDLTIVVELNSIKRARTVLTSTSTSSSTTSTAQSQDEVSVRFLEGSKIEGASRTYLTTKYTEVYQSTDNSENLGITNIDIDFNSQQMPLITIKFIDVRGSAIFQNENFVAGGKNKYSIFFQLPYPLFNLTIKGYYGQAVTYCLHMTKFTTRFNSQTGNFEITANFIGYTYAMFSDMLIGYLKAIGYTPQGKDKYKELNSNSNIKILKLDELMVAVSNIDEKIKNLSSKNPELTQVQLGNNSLLTLSKLMNYLNVLGTQIDYNSNLSEYPYFIANIDNVEKKSKDGTSFIEDYNTNIKTLIEDYNKTVDANLQLKTNDFSIPQNDYYPNITISGLTSSSTSLDDTTTASVLAYLKQNGYSISDKKPFNLYINTNIINRVNEQKNNITKEQQGHKLALAQSLRNEISNDIGFDPTVRNMINIFTTAIEVFAGIIWQVSKEAETSKARLDELKKVFKDANSTDIGSLTPAIPQNSNSPMEVKYYPWPDYRKKDDSNGYTEDYLGNAPGLTNPSAITELKFVDDLLKAFLTQYAESKKYEDLINNVVENWYPLNPIDTAFFVNQEPYARIEGNTPEEVILLVMLRASLVLGYANATLTDAEINNLANIEADAVFNQLKNRNIFKILNGNLSSGNSKYDKDAYINISNIINNLDTKVLTKNDNGDYEYNYITTINGVQDISVIPINRDFIGNDWILGPDSLANKAIDPPATVFVTNYQASNTSDTVNNYYPIKKPNDGGVYLSLIDIDKYNGSKAKLPSITNGTQVGATPFKLSVLTKKDPSSDSGFNILNGSFGTQEFKLVDLNDSDLKSQPYRLIFYDDSYKDNVKPVIKSNGLALKRGYTIDGIIDPKATTTTVFDFTGTTFTSFKNIYEYASFVDGISNYNDEPTNLHKYYGKNYLLSSKYINGNTSITYPYINFQVNKHDEDSSNLQTPNLINTLGMSPISLFGSRLYYEQTNEQAKALLFLHSFPWKGLNNDTEECANSTIFNNCGYEILNTFAKRAGFVSAPKLWAAFIGGLLTRYESDNDILTFHDGLISYIPTFGSQISDDYYPKKDEYLTIKTNYIGVSMSFISDKNSYKKLDTVILALPDQAKTTLKNIFNDFVTSDWPAFKKDLELIDSTTTNWVTNYNQINFTNNANGTVSVSKTQFQTLFKNTENYSMVNPIYWDASHGGHPDYRYNICLEIKDGSNVANNLTKYFVNNEVILANTTYSIWAESSNMNKGRRNIIIPNSYLDTYLTTFLENIRKNDKASKEDAEKKKAENDLFGTDNENVIKFQIYRTCKNIYDKWIGGAKDDKEVIFRCGNNRSEVDKSLAKQRNASEPKLIDSFRFVTRSFRDIGDELAVNPTPILTYLTSNPNSSAYDAITSLLSSNNFTFDALPSFINYRDEKLLETVFKPLGSYEMDAITNQKNTCYPTFVCVYAGQGSKHLDFKDSNYPNDGFDVRCINGALTGLPEDFTSNLWDYEEPVTFFNVRYGQQNQNIFKDIVLDQSEFSETEESLLITDSIAKKGSEKSRTLGGQNIYNVHAVRSYKVELEMLGNAMIQPLMYFQLDNIPMFHGAYMVTRVKHSIKPNHMTTHVTGSRIRQPETKILDASSLYMSLLDTIDSINSTTTAAGQFNNSSNKVPAPVGYSKQIPFVTYHINPSDTLKYQFNDGTYPNGDSYAMEAVGKFVENLSKLWYTQETPNKKSTNIVYVNCFGALNGGAYKKHGDSSLHYTGRAVDIMLMSNDRTKDPRSGAGTYTYKDSVNYDQEANKRFIQLVIDQDKKSTSVHVDAIFFNDPVLISHFSGQKSTSGKNILTAFEGHDNHIHIQFTVPTDVDTKIKNNQIPELITSNLPAGATQKLTSNQLPTESEKLKALGQIKS